MTRHFITFCMATALTYAIAAQASGGLQIRIDGNINNQSSTESPNALDELNPFDPQIEQKLRELDEQYIRATGQSPFEQGLGDAQTKLLNALDPLNTAEEASCYRLSCSVYAKIDRSEQKMYLYVNGQLQHEWLVSTGVAGHRTPDFDTHPNGRIYDRYSSRTYPGGDYMGLGNMPYAVFISGGFAIHGTTVGNFPKLGTPASHGCIRLHSDNGLIFNRLVRQYGIRDTWISVEE